MKITLPDRKPHEWVKPLWVNGDYFVGICHRGKCVIRSTKLNWIVWE